MTALPPGPFGAILADPPWAFKAWSGPDLPSRAADAHYSTMSMESIAALPVESVAAADCALFLWVCWPTLPEAIDIMRGWGFQYKTCGFCWVKGNSLPLFPDDFKDKMGLGYWTRANSEVCLLGTRGKPKRLNADVRQVIQFPLREHSRKPDGVHERIERLVAGPYLELFARQERPGWTVWGNETDKFGRAA
jgi:N6-adenosine-specific RNA methylase IME4